MIPESIFSLLITGILGLLIWVWVVIITAHMAYRRKVQRGEAPQVAYRLPWPKLSSVLVLGYLGVLIVLVIRDPETRAAFYVAAAWFGLLLLVYPKRAAAKKEVSDAWNA